MPTTRSTFPRGQEGQAAGPSADGGPATEAPMGTVAIIDGNSLMHRAFHAVPPTMNAPDGNPTNAVFGFIAMFLKLVGEFDLTGVVCAFDAGRPRFRMEAIEQYKAQRPPTDPDLKAQFPLVEHLLEAMNVPIVRIPGWEGDDILGTFARQGEESGCRILLVTGDKDAYQLASPTTSIVSTKKGLSEVVIYGPDQVKARYGVTPGQVPDYLGLKGDPSDNIPGVPGVGEKTAAKLIGEYGSLDNLLAHADEVKGKVGERLRANEDAARASRLVATIHRDLPVDRGLLDVRFPDFDPERVREAFGALRFNAHLGKVLELQARARSGAPGQGADTSTTGADPRLGSAAQGATVVVAPVVEGRAATSLLDHAVANHEWVGVAASLGSGEELFGTSLTLCVATHGGVARFEDDAVLPVLVGLIRGGLVAAGDMKRLLQVAVPADSSLPAALDASEVDPTRIFDASIAAYLLMSNATGYPVSALLLEYLDVIVPSGVDAFEGTIVDAAGALALRDELLRRLGEDDSLACLDRIELPLVPVLLQMERTGTALDTGVLRLQAATTGARLDGLRDEIYTLAGERFNIDSPKQLGEVLFERLALPTRKRTKTGYSTDAKVLESLSSLHPLPERVLRYRELAKMKSTYLDALPRLLGGDGRLHTTFNQTVTTTGRLSSSDPNLQNIPVRTAFGRQVREAFKPAEDDYVFLSADYSQIELRLLAHLSQDDNLIHAFTSGADFHRATAARVFDVDPDEVTPEMRSRAKAVNFGIVYGQQAFGLGQSLHIGYAEAQEMIDRYFEAYPQVRTYLDTTVAEARERGYATTIFGRRRHIPELASDNATVHSFGERTAMNHPMQGSAADIIKLAMVEVARRLALEHLSARLVLQVHDELDFECPIDEVERLSVLVADVMSHVVALSVPLNVSVSTGTSWSAAK